MNKNMLYVSIVWGIIAVFYMAGTAHFYARYRVEKAVDQGQDWNAGTMIVMRRNGAVVKKIDAGEAFEKILDNGPNTEKVTRVEVIDENGRSYVNLDPKNKVVLSFQDDSRTLKVFIQK